MRKTNLFSAKQPKFTSCFEKCYLFSRILQQNCYLYCFLRQNNFLKNPFFLTEKTRFWTLWENGIFQSHFTANLLVWAVFKKNNFFSENPPVFFKKNRTFESFEKSYSFSRILQQFWCFFQFFLKKNFVSKKPIFLKHQIFDRFEDFHLFSRILMQIW